MHLGKFKQALVLELAALGWKCWMEDGNDFTLPTAAYGHFGREEPEFTWERTDKAAALKAAAGI